MIKKLIMSIIFILLLVKPGLSVSTSSYIEPLPGDWWGTVKINDKYIADNSILNAYLNDNTTPVTSTVVGQLKSNYYLVHIIAQDGDNVSFKVNNISVEQPAQPWSEGDHQLNLSITVNDSLNSSVLDGQSCNSNSDCNSSFCVHNICRPSSPYCGDNFCDSGETCSSCSTDCGSCYTPPPGGDGPTVGAPPVTCKENWTCTDWSSCIGEIQTRTCTDKNKCDTTKSKPIESQSCAVLAQTTTNCTEDWSCNDWSVCVNNTQIRTCTDKNNCRTTSSKPTESQTCTLEKAPISAAVIAPTGLFLGLTTTELMMIIVAGIIVACVINYGVLKAKKKKSITSTQPTQ